MIRAVAAFVVFANLIVPAYAETVGEIMIVIHACESEIDGHVVEKLLPGMAVEIKAIENSQLKVTAFFSGWIDASHVIPMSDGISVLTTMIANSPDKASLLAGRALVLLTQKDFDKAIADCDEAVRLDPNYSLGYYYHGLVCQKRGDLSAAVNLFSNAIRCDSKFVRAYICRANTWILMNDVKKAIADFTKALNLDHTNATAYLNRGGLWTLTGEIDKGIADLSEAIRFDPANASAYLNRGFCWDKKGEIANAFCDYNEAIRLDPLSSEAYNNRGTLWDQIREFDKAIADFNEAIRLEPNSAGAFANRGQSWFKKNELDFAIDDYSAAIRLRPETSMIFQDRGRAWKLKGNFAAAIKDFTETTQREPNAYQGHDRLAWICATCPDEALRDGAMAIHFARIACELTSWNNRYALETLAAAYAETGEFESAIKRQEKAVELATEDEERRMGLERLALYKSEKPYREEHASVK